MCKTFTGSSFHFVCLRGERRDKDFEILLKFFLYIYWLKLYLVNNEQINQKRHSAKFSIGGLRGIKSI